MDLIHIYLTVCFVLAGFTLLAIYIKVNYYGLETEPEYSPGYGRIYIP